MRFVTRLKALQALEASARHGSFLGAAEELDVTPAAVGQLVRSLENWVGYPLFKRARTGTARLTPVEEVRDALSDISQGLDNFESGLNKLRGRLNRSVVVVTASQAFVANWLLGRLENFSVQHPQIDIRLDVSDQGIDLVSGEADIGIRCGMAPWHNLKATHLMGEEIIAVCHKTLISVSPSTEWLLRQTIIDDTTPQPGGEFPSWRDWLAAAGIDGTSKIRRMKINSTAAVIQAAIAGRGAALVRKSFVQRELEDGRLIELYPNHRWPVNWGYYVVASSRSLRRMEVKAFHDWMVLQTSVLRNTKPRMKA